MYSGFTAPQCALDGVLAVISGVDLDEAEAACLPLLGQPVEQGVDLGHPVAAEGDREADPAQVVGA